MTSSHPPNTEKKINCDQVAWLGGVLDRYSRVIMGTQDHTASRLKDAAKLAAMLEIMDILGLTFEDSKAAGNAISQFTEFNQLRGI